jgi:hypothetical protein
MQRNVGVHRQGLRLAVNLPSLFKVTAQCAQHTTLCLSIAYAMHGQTLDFGQTLSCFVGVLDQTLSD